MTAAAGIAAVASAAVIVARGAGGDRQRLTRLAGLHRSEPPPVPVGMWVAGVLPLVGVFIALGASVTGVGVVAAAAATTVVLWRRRARARVLAGRSAVIVEIVFALAAELRSGRTPGEALDAAAEGGHALHLELTAAAGAVRAGGCAPDELRRLATAPGCAPLAAVGAAWQVTERCGGPVADVLDRLAESLDADAEVRRALEAALAGPRATMALLATLPLLGVALGQAVGAAPLRLLLHRPLGWALLAAAAVLDAAGVAWTGWLGRAVTRG